MLRDHWSDLSVYVLKALVPFFIYVQGCFLLMSPNHAILSLFAVLLLDLSVWPPFLSTLFLCCFCFLCCIKHRHIYCHLNNYWVSLFFRFAFVWQNKPQLSVLRTCTLEHVFLQLFFFFRMRILSQTWEELFCSLPSSLPLSYPLFILSWSSVQENVVSPPPELTTDLRHSSCCTDLWIVHILKDIAVTCSTWWKF